MNEDSLKESEGDIEDNLAKCDESLLQTTEFAALCSFIHHFGTELGIYLTFPQLEQFLSLGNSANWKNWETLHIKLLNKLKYRARPEKWEPVLGRFLFNHAADIDGLPEAAECLVSGVRDKPSMQSQPIPVHISRPYSPVYYGLDVEVRTRLLLALLESQFDRNPGFKEKVNLRSAVDLRFRPLGYDVWGRIYWLLKDSEVNVLLYREDSERRTFQLLCRTAEEIRAVHSQLEDACPTSMKLSDILKNRTDTAFGSEKDGSASPSLTTTLHQLVQDGIASTEAEQKIHLSAETTLTNGMECDTLNQTPDSTQSPNCVVHNGFDESNQPDDVLPLSEIKPEPHLKKPVESTNSPEPVPKNPKSPPKTEVEGVEMKPSSNKSSPLAKIGELESGSCDKIDDDQDRVKVEVKSEGDQDESVLNVGSRIASARPKCNKRGRGSKASRRQPDGSLAESTPALEVRRSGRVRKPVEFLTIEVPQPKRPRQFIKLAEPVTNGTDKQRKKKRRSKVVDELAKKKKKRPKKKRRHAKKPRSSNPWMNATSSSESDEDDTFERALREHDKMAYDSDTVDANRNEPDTLDWIDRPESDFNPDELDKESDVDSLTQGRNFARQKRLERMRVSRTTSALTSNAYVDETCQVCGKAHEPEWILLCDRCDRGHHAMCLCPPLFVIPEGDWFCPRCQHATLLHTLAECADQIDSEQKKQTIWKRMQERLNFVNISMTNILADGDEEGEENGRRRRGRSTAQVVYQDSDSSQDDLDDNENDTEPDSDKSASSFLVNGSGSGSELFCGRRASFRRRAAYNPHLTSYSMKRRATSRRGRNRWLSGSGDESTSASSDVSFAAPAPRAARQRPVQYDLGEAFKQLDEALEDDEKYQEEKRRRRSKKLNREGEGGTPENQNCSASPSSGPPPNRSCGKDLSNVMGPDWENQLELDRPGRSRKRRTRVLSSSSADSDDSRTPIPGNKQRRKGSSDDTGDADFQPSGTSEDFSGQSDDDDGNEAESTSESDTSWLCAARRRKHGAGTKTSRSFRLDRKRPKYSGRRRGRPVPRFEQSEDEVPLYEAGSHESSSRVRPRRCARAVVSYRELDDQDENNSNSTGDDSDAKAHEVRSTNRRRLVSSTDEDTSPGDRKSRASSAEAPKLDRPPTPISKLIKSKSARAATRRRRVLSSSGSEYQPDQSEKDDEKDGDQLDETTEVKPRITDSSIDRSVEVEEATLFESHRMDKSYVFDQSEDAPSATRSEGSSPTGLRITESSPEPPSPSVIPLKELLAPPKCVQSGHSQDEESVEEDAEDLLPRHPIPSHLTSGEKSSNQTSKVPASPDLFT
ncbi:putative Remodeling and spacing factor 1/sw [Fasciola hepatica]|uniref:Remodeling and spacing factor 1/sw n=1 Tax=Fasciola hepatica TaxID=6192 RepID=A0A4E0RU90_FASHE|nr:putative Remodeling and spacing factor 1/sw [Fasciola hepatica]